MSFSVFAATASVTLHFYFPIFPLYKIKAANVRMLQKAMDTKRLLHLSKFCPNIFKPTFVLKKLPTFVNF